MTPIQHMRWRELLADYGGAMRRLPEIFRTIGFRKRTLEDQLNEALLQGNLRRVFSKFDLVMLGLGITIGAGVWQLSGYAENQLAGSSIIISYLFAGLATTGAAACYGELAVAYPVAGASFTYTMLTFGEFPAWMTVMNQMSIEVFGSAAVGRSFSTYLAGLAGQRPDFFRLLASNSGYDGIDPMAGGVTIVATLILVLSGRLSSLINSIITMIKLAVIVFIIIVAFTQAEPANLHPFFKQYDFGGVFAAASVFIYTMTGFDSVANAAEEARTARNVNALPPAMTLVPAIATVVYVLIALSFSMVLPAIRVDPAYGYMNIFNNIGMRYMNYIIAFAAVLGSFTGMLVGLYTGSRLTMVVSRDWMLPPFLARVSRRTQTPAIAQLVLGLIVTLIAIFVSFEFLADLVNFGQLFAMWVVINAQLFRRYFPGIKLRFTKHGTIEALNERPTTWVPGSRIMLSLKTRRRLVVVHLILISVTALGLATWFSSTIGKSRSLEVAGCVAWAVVLFLSTLSLQLFCPLYYEPKQWHIPAYLLPWVPVLSIALIMFGITSIDSDSWLKIGVYNAIALVFYFVYSLPMSYIKHYKLDFDMVEQLNVVQYDFVDGRWAPMANRSLPATSSIVSTTPTVSSLESRTQHLPTGRGSERLIRQVQGALQHQLGNLLPRQLTIDRKESSPKDSKTDSANTHSLDTSTEK